MLPRGSLRNQLACFACACPRALFCTCKRFTVASLWASATSASLLSKPCCRPWQRLCTMMHATCTSTAHVEQRTQKLRPSWRRLTWPLSATSFTWQATRMLGASKHVTRSSRPTKLFSLVLGLQFASSPSHGLASTSTKPSTWTNTVFSSSSSTWRGATMLNHSAGRLQAGRGSRLFGCGGCCAASKKVRTLRGSGTSPGSLWVS